MRICVPRHTRSVRVFVCICGFSRKFCTHTSEKHTGFARVFVCICVFSRISCTHTRFARVYVVFRVYRVHTLATLVCVHIEWHRFVQYFRIHSNDSLLDSTIHLFLNMPTYTRIILCVCLVCRLITLLLLKG